MKAFKKITVCALLAVSFVLPAFSVKPQTKAAAAGTGYTKASDVNYVKNGNYVANWGARDEDCVFLSEYAEDFYTNEYTYEILSQEKGGKGFANTHKTPLYTSLQSLMKSKHKNVTSYGDTRYVFCYTDCVQSNYDDISSFYSGKTISGTWDQGKTWNREHTWPNSKGNLAGNGENDIMMLRPASVSENSSRGNKAYGESSGYYDPNGEGQSVRGDCARIILYQYVRWGAINTGSEYNPNDIFGTKGVIQSLNVLLKWMEEDPVDTWEMGRNDAVQSVTGTRNVFVDYPEYAWLLFGQEIPDDMVTPSGMAKNDTPPEDSSSEENSSVAEDSSIVEDSSVAEDSSIVEDSSVEENTSEEEDSSSESADDEEECKHEFGLWFTMIEPTKLTEGERRRKCKLCSYVEKQILVPCEHEFGEWIVMEEPTESSEGLIKRRCKICQLIEERTPFAIVEQEGCSSSVASLSGISLLLAALAVCKRKR